MNVAVVPAALLKGQSAHPRSCDPSHIPRLTDDSPMLFRLSVRTGL